MKYLGLILIGGLAVSPAFAEDLNNEASELRELVNCFPSKGITEFVSKFQNMEPEKRDTVDMLFSAEFKANDGGALPDRIFIRDNGVEQNFLLGADGEVPDFEKIGKASETAEICFEDPSRVGTPKGEGLNFSISSDVQFFSNTGYHDIASLQDGLKDGKSHYKKMVPAPMRMLVPTLKYVMIEYDAEGTAPQYSALKGETPIKGLDHVTFCESPMVKVKDLEKLGADGLKIMGGSYKLTPVPGVKTLARFTECSKDKENTSDN